MRQLRLRLWRVWQALDRRLSAIESSFVGLCLIGGAALNFALVMGRYVLGVSMSEFEELSVYLIIWMTFVGMVVADRCRTHITIDILHHLTPPTVRVWLDRFTHMATACVGLALAWLSFDATRFSFDIGERAVSTLETPIWLVMAIMPPTFLLLGLRNLRRALAPSGVSNAHDT